MIEFHEVSKRFGLKLAVDRLTLRIDRGELFTLLGPNGAGKTTSIKLMCGLLFPTSGSVSISGYDIQRQGDQARARISYIPDQPFVYEKLTGREYLQFIADMYGLPRDAGRKRIEAMIELFDLGEFVDELSERYSHGMRQRTVFAAALLHEPKVLIVDEPTVGLDQASQASLAAIMTAHLTKGGLILAATHVPLGIEATGRLDMGRSP